jgi:hypothetical protein
VRCCRQNSEELVRVNVTLKLLAENARGFPDAYKHDLSALPVRPVMEPNATEQKIRASF